MLKTNSARKRLKNYTGRMANGTLLNPWTLADKDTHRDLELLEYQQQWEREQSRRDEERKHRKLERKAFKGGRR